MSDCCLVFEALERTEIYCAPTTKAGYETGKFFTRGDYVSVDQIKDPFTTANRDESNKGIFLRLSDGSGWVPLTNQLQKKDNFREVPLEKGLWCFYVDSFPDGIVAHNHPISELQHLWQTLLLETTPKIHLRPMTKIFCDRRVAGPDDTSYYRLQHGLRQITCWVADKRKTLEYPEQSRNLLVSENAIQQGIFAFRARNPLKLRLYPLSSKIRADNVTGVSVIPNDIFVVDLIRGKNTYMRLIDGSGWVYAGHSSGKPQVEQVAIETGKFVFRVTTPYGVKLQTLPGDDRSAFGEAMKQNQIVNCDCKLVPDSLASYGRTFYHVEGTNGWVSDMDRDRQLMQPVQADRKADAANGDSWTSGFVRGVAIASMTGVEEISYNEDSQLISFNHPAGATLNVFYGTRTVGITRGSGGAQSFCRNCTNTELVEIFRNPEAHIKEDQEMDEPAKDDDPSELTPEQLTQEEVDARDQLVKLDKDYLNYVSKKEEIWKVVSKHQARRDGAEAEHYERWCGHMKDILEGEEKKKREEEASKRFGGSKVLMHDKCYVYRVIHDIGVRSAPNAGEEYRTEKAFCAGDIVSFDNMLDFVSSNECGPYLRLSDGSGWLFVKDDQGVVMEELKIWIGSWTFYVGNEPTGIGLRKHPMDQQQDGTKGYVFDEDTSLNFLKPFEKVVCDRRVIGKDGVSFFRVCGHPRTCWIFDKRYKGDRTDTLLYPANQVREGLFAFQALDELAIRRHASVSRKHKMKRGISVGDVVIVDLIFEPERDDSGTGPFLRLADGSGWLFMKIDGDRVMKDIPMRTGRWKFRICHPQGLKLRKQPSEKPYDRSSNDAEIVYKKDRVVVCDREVSSTTGETYCYRPVGVNGWLPSFHGKIRFMEDVPDDTPEDQVGFNVDFVRGLAMGIEGVQEVEHNSSAQVVTFQDSKGLSLTVYCATQTVSISSKDSAQSLSKLREDCTKEDLVEIFKQSAGDDGPRPSKRRRLGWTADDNNVEDDFRARLLELEQEAEEIKRQREEIWKSVREHERKQEEEGGDRSSMKPEPY